MVPVVLQMYLMWPWLRHRAQMPMCEQRPRSASYSLQSKLLVNCQACCPLYGIGRILLFSFSRVSSAFPAGRLLQQPARLAVMPEMWQTFDASPDMSGQLPKQQQILSDANGADCQPAASAATSPVSRCMDPQQVPDDPDSAAPQTHQSSPHAHTHRYPNTTFFCTSGCFIDCIIEHLMSMFAVVQSNKHVTLCLLQALNRLVVYNVIWQM